MVSIYQSGAIFGSKEKIANWTKQNLTSLCKYQLQFTLL